MKCFICRRYKAQVLDHCHVCGMYRGWLCLSCNQNIANDKVNRSLFSAWVANDDFTPNEKETRLLRIVGQRAQRYLEEHHKICVKPNFSVRSARNDSRYRSAATYWKATATFWREKYRKDHPSS
jgi:hypothetical protein